MRRDLAIGVVLAPREILPGRQVGLPYACAQGVGRFHSRNRFDEFGAVMAVALGHGEPAGEVRRPKKLAVRK